MAGERCDTSLVELRAITKRFGAVVANDGIDLDLAAGEVHAVLGENGAGKSTLTKVLYGLIQPDAGEIVIGGEQRRLRSPADAMAAGIGMVTQEFSLVGPMTVAENVMLPSIGLGRVDRRAGSAEVSAVAGRVGITVDPDATVESLSVGERQRIEIIKALSRDCRVLILDEPTAVLTPQDVEALFGTIRRLTADGLGVVFISHKLREVAAIADRVTVLRRGRRIVTQPAAQVGTERLASLMVGGDDDSTDDIDPAAIGSAPPTELANVSPAPPTPAPADAPPALELRSVSVSSDGVVQLDDVSLSVARGEIVGIAGVSGNGQTQLVAALAATIEPAAGSILVDGVDVTRLDVTARLAAGLGRITDDRRGSVVPALTVEQNLVLEDLDRFRRWGLTNRRLMREHTRRLMADYDIRATPNAPIRTLSGGNMQKVLLARALSRRPRALVVSQPTRGLDVGAYQYVHERLRDVRSDGGGVLVVSEDLDELFSLADRLVVLFAGRVIGELPVADATPEALGLLMTGHAMIGRGIRGSGR